VELVWGILSKTPQFEEKRKRFSCCVGSEDTHAKMKNIETGNENADAVS